MKPTILPLCILLALVFSPFTGRSQWIGEGTTNGTNSNDFNDLDNWTNKTIDGNFSSLTDNVTINLSSDASVASLNFTWTTVGHNVTIRGNGLGEAKVLTLSGGITMPRATSSGALVFGDNLILDFGSITSIRDIQRGGTSSGTIGTLKIDSLITGTASGSGAIRFANNATFTTTLTNDNNTFSSPIFLAGRLNFTSISNVGGGASSLGNATTVENGTITLNRNAVFAYTGTTDQSSDRRIAISAGVGPVEIRHAGENGKLTLSSNLDTGTYTNNLNLQAENTSATLELTGAITNTENGATRVIISAAGGTGTVALRSVDSNYKGKTTITRGVLEVTKLANGGENSSIGASSNDAANLSTGDWGNTSPVLRYVGTGDTTDRLFTIARYGITIESSGTGALEFTNTGSISTVGTANRDSEARTLTLSGTNTGNNVFSPTLGDHVYNEGNNSTAANLTKTGSGKWILAGNHTYTGATNVNAGTLIVNGTLTSAITNSGGTLGGAGRTTQDVIIGNASGTRDSILAVGGEFGGFSTNATLTLRGDAEVRFLLDSTIGTAATVNADSITITSSAAYFNFDVTGDGSGLTLGQAFVVLNNTGGSSIAGTFTNLAEGATIESIFGNRTVTWQASYFGLDGTSNDLVLTIIADVTSVVPEPTTWATLAGAVLLVFAFTYRRRYY